MTTAFRKVVRTTHANTRGLAYVGIDIRCAILPKNGESFVDKNSKQPAAKSAFSFKPRWIAKSGEPTVVDSILDPFRTAKHPTADELKRPITA
jgi:hypothetical protein